MLEIYAEAAYYAARGWGEEAPRGLVQAALARQIGRDAVWTASVARSDAVYDRGPSPPDDNDPPGYVEATDPLLDYVERAFCALATYGEEEQARTGVEWEPRGWYGDRTASPPEWFNVDATLIGPGVRDGVDYVITSEETLDSSRDSKRNLCQGRLRDLRELRLGPPGVPWVPQHRFPDAPARLRGLDRFRVLLILPLEDRVVPFYVYEAGAGVLVDL